MVLILCRTLRERRALTRVRLPIHQRSSDSADARYIEVAVFSIRIAVFVDEANA
jgi:hypothetical protein